MMRWVAPMMWGFSRLLGFTLQLIGFTGILLAALLALRALCVWIDG